MHVITFCESCLSVESKESRDEDLPPGNLSPEPKNKKMINFYNSSYKSLKLNELIKKLYFYRNIKFTSVFVNIFLS